MGTILAILGWAAVIVLGLVALIAVISIPHNLRVRRVRRVFGAIPGEIKDRILALIEKAASQSPSVTFLRLDENQCPPEDNVQLASHVGGLPYAEGNDDWPPGIAEKEPSRFLIQVRIDEPSLGSRWQGRLICVFLVFDAEQIVRSYAAPTPGKHKCLDSPEPPFGCIRLNTLRIPTESDTDRVPTSPKRLCEMIPAISAVLRPFTKDAPGVVAQILRPHLYGYNLEEPDIAYVGGDPMLIQNLHKPVCAKCGRQMRFLFQFGEVIPEWQLADGGVCYVYGCDDHPDQCRAFIDSH